MVLMIVPFVLCSIFLVQAADAQGGTCDPTAGSCSRKQLGDSLMQTRSIGKKAAMVSEETLEQEEEEEEQQKEEKAEEVPAASASTASSAQLGETREQLGRAQIDSKVANKPSRPIGSALLQEKLVVAQQATNTSQGEQTDGEQSDEPPAGSTVDTQPTEHTSVANSLICPLDAGDEALSQWLEYFESVCFVSSDDVSAELYEAIGRACATPELNVQNEVRCRVAAASGIEAGQLAFAIKQGSDMSRAWGTVAGSEALYEVEDGKLVQATAPEGSDMPAPCSVFGETVPRIANVSEEMAEDVFDLYRSEYQTACGGNASAIFRVQGPVLGKREISGDGIFLWEAPIQVTADDTISVSMFWKEERVVAGLEEAHSQLTLDHTETSPQACEWCNACPQSLAEERLVDHMRGRLSVEEEEEEGDQEESEEELRSRLAELAKQRADNEGDEEAMEPLLAETAHLRGQLAAARAHLRPRLGRFIGPAGGSGGGGGGADVPQREFGFGDNFHQEVLPKRTAEEHKAVHAMSDALIHLVSKELGGEGVSVGETNELMDGGFEESTGNPHKDYFAGETTIEGGQGWRVNKGKVQVGRLSTNYDLPLQGTSLLHLCGSGKGSIEQDFATQAGVEYVLSFGYSGNPAGTSNQLVRVSIISDGTTIHDETVAARPRYSSSQCRFTCWAWKYMQWKRHKVHFTARGSAATVQFEAVEDRTGCALLDDIWVAHPPWHNLPASYHFFSTFETKCWRPAYNQGKCGSCWAFASVGALEKQYCMRAKGLMKPSLSREMLVRCSVQNNACGGGNANTAYADLMEIGGLWQTKCLPYQGEGSKHCPAFSYSWFGQDAVGKTGKLARIDQEMQSRCDDLRRFSNRPPLGEEWDLPFTMIYAKRTGRMPDYEDPDLATYRRYFAKARSRDNTPSWWLYGEQAMQAAIIKYGSVYASFKVKDDFNMKPPVGRMCKDHCWPYGQMYGEDGHEAQCGCGGSGHAIQIIGYDTDTLESGEDVPYWQIENSWGTDGHQDLFGGEPGDPFTRDYPENYDDCVLVVGLQGGASPGGQADGWELLLWIDDNGTAMPAHANNVSAVEEQFGCTRKDVTESQVLVKNLALTPGDHHMTFEIHAKKHNKVRGIPIESYGIFMPMLRCRSQGFRFDFLKQIHTVELSWNKPTRAELIRKADNLLQKNGINPNTVAPNCPMRCKQGRFSSRHPCLNILTWWGRCYTSSWYARYMTHNCTMCDEEIALIDQKARLVQMLPNHTFIEWFGIIHDALGAPDEPGFNRVPSTGCSIVTAGHNNYSRMNATFRFTVPDRKTCDKRNTAMVKPTTHPSLKVFVRPDGEMADGEQRSVACPSPLGGQAELTCQAGKLRVKSHTCAAQNGMDIARRGYYRMRRGINYHGIETGAAFAIAELGVSNILCPTAGWTVWSLCNSTGVCEEGMQTRMRVPKEPLTTDSPECAGIVFSESRPCLRPGFCRQILARFAGHSSSSVQSFLGSYKGASTTLPMPTAGAHILGSLYAPCAELTHWCSVVTGRKTCTVLVQGQIQVHTRGAYRMEFTGSGLSGHSEAIFSPHRDRDAAADQHYRIKLNKAMELFTDKGQLHRRRRAGKGDSEWRPAPDAHFEPGYYVVWVLLTGWSTCPNYILKLHARTGFEPAVVYDKTRPPTDPDFATLGPNLQMQHKGQWIRKKFFESNFKLTAEKMYSEMSLDQYTEQLSNSQTVIRGQMVVPEAGVYKLEVRMDVECQEEVLWKFCEPNSRRRSGRLQISALDQSSGKSMSVWRDGYQNVVVDGLIEASGEAPLTVTIVVHSKSHDAGKRVNIAAEGDSPVFEVVPMPGKYVLPNVVELVWAKFDRLGQGSPYHADPQAVDLLSEIKYQREIQVLRGDEVVRVKWPDRDVPFDNEYQIQPLNITPPDKFLLGAEKMYGFVAEVEARVDAGACVSAVAEAEHSADEAHAGSLRGFGLQLCDVDGDKQYLEFFKLLHDSTETVQMGWLHIEFQHPTHLRIMRDITSKTLDIGYRPDNRAHYARVWDNFQSQLEVPDHFWERPLQVGVSMTTDRTYRWAEFYNISIDECPHQCTSAEGKKLLCGGKVTTPCGSEIECDSSCDAGDSCVEGHCFTCPPQEDHHDSWDCGFRTEICEDHQHRQFEKEVPVGEGCVEPFECKEDNKCHCDPATRFTYMAIGFDCGSMPDKCGGNVSLGDCSYGNAECINNVCQCEATDFIAPDSIAVIEGWNCGTSPSGCGRTVAFGDMNGMCPLSQICTDRVCCSPMVFPGSHECGTVYDTCLKETITFTSAMEEWQLVMRQGKAWGGRRRYPYWYKTPPGSEKDSNYVRGDYYDWRRDRVNKNYFDEHNKFTFKVLYTGANLPTEKPFNIWKQLDHPSNIHCYGRAVNGFEAVETNLEVNSGFGGICRGYESIVEGQAKSRRRRNSGTKILLGTPGLGFQAMPGGTAEAVELYAMLHKARDGSCPFPNGQCLQNHSCACVKNEAPEGAECHEMDDGCGGKLVFQYVNNSAGDAQDGPQAEEEFHLSPRGWERCDYGANPSEDACLAAGQSVLEATGHTPGRTALVTGQWHYAPFGCSVQSGGDWAVHYNSYQGTNDGGYSSVCGNEVLPGKCPSGLVCNRQTFKCLKPEYPTADELRKCLTQDVQALRQELQHLYPFRDGTSSNTIWDGGADMYDGGNRIRIHAKGSNRWSHYLNFNQKCAEGWSSAGVGDIKYFTCKITAPATVWFAGFHSESGDIDRLRVDGNLGADNRGHASGGYLNQWQNGKLWGYYKQVFGTGDPSINQVILVPNSEWRNAYSRWTNDGHHEVHGAKPVKTLLYVMWGGRKGNSGVQYSAQDFKDAMASVNIGC